MQRSLRLTITAVGEPDSVFLTPCDPITLHESAIESESDHDEAGDEGAAEGSQHAAHALAEMSEHDIMILMDDDDTPVRRAS